MRLNRPADWAKLTICMLSAAHYCAAGEVHAGSGLPVAQSSQVISANCITPATTSQRSAAEMFASASRAQANRGFPFEYRWLRSAAEHGDAAARSNLGAMYVDGRQLERDQIEAANRIREAALQDEQLAQHNLGLMFRDGLGVEKDDIEAAWWFRKSAEAGYPDAQAQLGLMYWEGRGVPHDDAEAVQWFRKAAERGDALAQYYFGVGLAQGRGVDEDHEQALKWLSIAACQGLGLARDYLWANGIMSAATRN